MYYIREVGGGVIPCISIVDTFFYLFLSFMAKAELGRKEEGSNFTVLNILSQILKKKQNTFT